MESLLQHLRSVGRGALVASLALGACATVDPRRAETRRQAEAASAMEDWDRAAYLWYGLYREDPQRSSKLAAPAAEALLRSGDPESALSVVRDGRRRGADGPELSRIAARARIRLGDRAGAVSDLRSALDGRPDRADWWWDLSRWLAEEGDAFHAHEALRRALELGFDAPELPLHDARLLTHLGRHVEAHDRWRAALDGGDGAATDAKALTEGATLAVLPRLSVERPGALARGVAWFQRAAALEPQALEVQRRLAHAALLSGDQDLAVTAFERAVELDPTDQTTLGDLAALHLARGDRGRARDLLLRALDLETHPDLAREWRARIDATEVREEAEPDREAAAAAGAASAASAASAEGSELPAADAEDPR